MIQFDSLLRQKIAITPHSIHSARTLGSVAVLIAGRGVSGLVNVFTLMEITASLRPLPTGKQGSVLSTSA